MQIYFHIMTCLLIAGCSAISNDWPNLTDPLPDPAERVRIFEMAEPAPFTPITINMPTNPTEAEALIAEITPLLSEEKTAFEKALNTLETNTQSYREHWLTAQLRLTRLSHTLSRLDNLADSERTTLTTAKTKALQLRSDYGDYIVNARNRLGSEPSGGPIS